MAPPTAGDRTIRDELVFGQLQECWDALYSSALVDGVYVAHRRAGGPLLTAATPGGLAQAIWRDWSGGAS